MAYPHRPAKKTKPKSSEHIHGRRKTWLSEGTHIVQGADLSPRIGNPWWKSPLMKSERLRRAATRRNVGGGEDA